MTLTGRCCCGKCKVVGLYGAFQVDEEFAVYPWTSFPVGSRVQQSVTVDADSNFVFPEDSKNDPSDMGLLICGYYCNVTESSGQDSGFSLPTEEATRKFLSSGRTLLIWCDAVGADDALTASRAAAVNIFLHNIGSSMKWVASKSGPIPHVGAFSVLNEPYPELIGLASVPDSQIQTLYVDNPGEVEVAAGVSEALLSIPLGSLGNVAVIGRETVGYGTVLLVCDRHIFSPLPAGSGNVSPYDTYNTDNEQFLENIVTTAHCGSPFGCECANTHRPHAWLLDFPSAMSYSSGISDVNEELEAQASSSYADVTTVHYSFMNLYRRLPPIGLVGDSNRLELKWSSRTQDNNHCEWAKVVGTLHATEIHIGAPSGSLNTCCESMCKPYVEVTSELLTGSFEFERRILTDVHPGYPNAQNVVSSLPPPHCEETWCYPRGAANGWPHYWPDAGKRYCAYLFAGWSVELVISDSKIQAKIRWMPLVRAVTYGEVRTYREDVLIDSEEWYRGIWADEHADISHRLSTQGTGFPSLYSQLHTYAPRGDFGDLMIGALNPEHGLKYVWEKELHCDDLSGSPVALTLVPPEESYGDGVTLWDLVGIQNVPETIYVTPIP